MYVCVLVSPIGRQLLPEERANRQSPLFSKQPFAFQNHKEQHKTEHGEQKPQPPPQGKAL